jgi:pimeloyl-ACP methyl ester carboxylesterase
MRLPKPAYYLILNLFYFASSSFAQKQIAYDSNNGKIISILNTKIYYEEYGQGMPLILLHGGMGSIADFSLCIPELAKHYHVIAPDAPGQSRSEMSDSISYELLAEYVYQMILKLNVDSVYIMGWSDGGNAALILASEHPDKVKKVLVSGANYKFSGYIFGDSLKPIPADYKPPAEEQKSIDDYFKVNPGQWRKIVNDRIAMWAKEIYFPASILEKIHMPVMLVLGDKDAVTAEHGLEMHRLIRGSYFCILPNTSHKVFAERPKLIDEIAIDFFAK